MRRLVNNKVLTLFLVLSHSIKGNLIVHHSFCIYRSMTAFHQLLLYNHIPQLSDITVTQGIFMRAFAERLKCRQPKV